MLYTTFSMIFCSWSYLLVLIRIFITCVVRDKDDPDRTGSIKCRCAMPYRSQMLVCSLTIVIHVIHLQSARCQGQTLAMPTINRTPIRQFYLIGVSSRSTAILDAVWSAVAWLIQHSTRASVRSRVNTRSTGFADIFVHLIGGSRRSSFYRLRVMNPTVQRYPAMLLRYPVASCSASGSGCRQRC